MKKKPVKKKITVKKKPVKKKRKIKLPKGGSGFLGFAEGQTE